MVSESTPTILESARGRPMSTDTDSSIENLRIRKKKARIKKSRKPLIINSETDDSDNDSQLAFHGENELSLLLSPAINLKNNNSHISQTNSSSPISSTQDTSPLNSQKVQPVSQNSATTLLNSSDSSDTIDINSRLKSSSHQHSHTNNANSSDKNSSSSSSDEDFSHLRLFRNKTKNTGTENLGQSNDLDSDGPPSPSQILDKSTRKAALSANEIIKLKSETERLSRENPLHLPKKLNNARLSLKQFMQNATSLIKTPTRAQNLPSATSTSIEDMDTADCSATPENQSIPESPIGQCPLVSKLAKENSPDTKSASQGLTPTTKAARKARASLIRQWKSSISKQIPKTPDTKVTVGLVSFDLDDASKSSQKEVNLFKKVLKNKNLFAISPQSNSNTNSSSVISLPTSVDPGSGSISESQKSRFLDVLVKRENSETGTVELVRENVALPEPKNAGMGPTNSNKLKSCLKKKILKMKQVNHDTRTAQHLLRLDNYNAQFDSDGLQFFDENEETLLEEENHSSQKHHNIMQAFNEDSRSTNQSQIAQSRRDSIWEESDIDDDLSKLLASNSRTSEQVDSLTFIDGQSSASQHVSTQKAILRGLNLPTQKRTQNPEQELDFEITQQEQDIDCSDEFPEPSDDESVKNRHKVESYLEKVCDVENIEPLEEEADETSDNSSDSDDDFFEQIRRRREAEAKEKLLEIELHQKQTSNSTDSVSGNDLVKEYQNGHNESDENLDDVELTIKRSKHHQHKKLVTETAKNLFQNEADLSDEEDRPKYHDSQEDADDSDLDHYEEEENDEILPDKPIIEEGILDKFKKQERIDDAEELALLKAQFAKHNDSDDDFDLPKVERFNWDDNSENNLLQNFNSSSDDDDDNGVELYQPDPKNHKPLSKFVMEPDENAGMMQMHPTAEQSDKPEIDLEKENEYNLPLFNIPEASGFKKSNTQSKPLLQKSTGSRFFTKFGKTKQTAPATGKTKTSVVQSIFIEDSTDASGSNFPGTDGSESRSKHAASRGMTFSSARYLDEDTNTSSNTGVSRWGIDSESLQHSKKRKSESDLSNDSSRKFAERLFKRQRSGEIGNEPSAANFNLSESSTSSNLFRSFAKT